MAYNLGVARGVIELIYNSRGTDKAKEDLDETLSKASRNKDALDSMGRSATIAGVALAAGLGLAVTSAANFEKRMNAVKAVSGASASEMETLRKKAIQLGADTSFSATEAASAIEELVKAGVSIPDVMNGAADAVVALASAGEIALPEAATIAASAMNNFNLTAKEMPQIADLIAGAANASAIDVGEFGQSLQQAGAVANLAGLSFEDTAVAIALMGNAGIRGSDAGTSLKTMLQNLQPATKKQSDLFKELGLITKDGTNQFYDQNGQLKSLAEVSGILQKSLSGMTDQQKAMALETLFGSDAIRAAAILTDEGATGFNKMATAMGKVSAADVAATRMEGLAGEVEKLKGSAETLAIGLGTVLIPALVSLTQQLGKAVDWFSSLSPATQKNIVYAVALASGLLLLFAAAVKIASGIMTLNAALAAFKATTIGAAIASKAAAAAKLVWATAARVAGVAFRFMLGPIGIIIAVIALLVAAIIYLWKNNETFRNVVMKVWTAIKNAVKAVVDWFTGTLVPTLVSVFKTIMGAVRAWWQINVQLWNLVISIIRTAIGFIVSIVLAFVTHLRAVWEGFWSVFGGLVKAVWGLIVAVIRLYIAIIGLVIRTGIAVIKAIWTAVWRFIQTYVVGVWKAIYNFVSSLVKRVVNFIRGQLNAARAIVVAIWNYIKSITLAAWRAFYSYISGPLNRARAIVSSVVNRVRSYISSAWNYVRSITSRIWNGLYSSVRNAINRVLGVVRGVRSRITGFFSGAGRWLWNAGRNIISGLIDGIQSMISRVTGLLNNLTEKIKNAKGPEERDKKLLVENAHNIMGGLIKGFQQYIPRVERLLGNLTTSMPEMLSTPAVASLGLPPSPTGNAGNSTVTTTTFAPGSIVLDASKLRSVDDLIRMVDGIKSTARQFGAKVKHS